MDKKKWIPTQDAWLYFEGNVCTDIKVSTPGTSVRLEAPEFALRNCKRSFSGVKALIIPKGVKKIDIPNSLFPNVEHVISDSDKFLTSTMLVRKSITQGNTLLNAFCKSEDDVVDLHRVNKIDNFAFEGCRSWSLVNDASVEYVAENAFTDSAFMEQPFKGGIKLAGHIMIAMDDTAEEIVIPQEPQIFVLSEKVQSVIRDTKYAGTNIKRMRVKCLDFVEAFCYMPETVILDSKEKCTWSKVSRTICGIVSDNTKNLISEIPRYKSVDGILYSSDMKTLCFCPGGKTGHVTIPEGVTKIKDMAFYSSEIHSVKLPDTLQDIGSQAFQLCHNLTHIDFGNGIRRLGANGHCQIFDVCNSLESVEFPAQIEYIGHNCFENCKKLRNVKFNEGLQEIGPEAFMDCESLKNVEFPSTLKKVGKRSFTATDGVKWLKLKIIPFGFVHAFISNAGPCGQRYMDVDYNGKHFAIPKRMDTCRLSECVQRFEPECISWCGLTDDFLDSLYLYSRSKIEKHLCAMVAYKYTRKEQIKKDIYGRCNTSTVHGITEPERVLLALDEKDLSEKEFVDCLNTGFVDARPELIDEVKKKGWNIAVAYILDKSKEPEKVNLSL